MMKCNMRAVICVLFALLLGLSKATDTEHDQYLRKDEALSLAVFDGDEQQVHSITEALYLSDGDYSGHEQQVHSIGVHNSFRNPNNSLRNPNRWRYIIFSPTELKRVDCQVGKGRPVTDTRLRKDIMIRFRNPGAEWSNWNRFNVSSRRIDPKMVIEFQLKYDFGDNNMEWVVDEDRSIVLHPYPGGSEIANFGMLNGETQTMVTYPGQLVDRFEIKFYLVRNTFCLEGNVWDDSDYNGIKDRREPPIPRQTVFLHLKETVNAPDPDWTKVPTDYETASNGRYPSARGKAIAEQAVFRDRRHQVFKIRLAERENYVPTQRIHFVWNDLEDDSDLNDDWQSDEIQVTPGSSYEVDAGLVECVDFTLDFNKFPDGSQVKPAVYVQNEWDDAFGMTLSASGGLKTTPRVFDSANPTGDDFDLGSPNEKCPKKGPGKGEGGRPKSPGENCEPLGNVLIVQEVNNSPGIPDDERRGGQISFDFDPPMRKVYSIGLLDIEDEFTSVEVVHDALNNPVPFTFFADNKGDNGKQLVDLGDLDHVSTVKVDFFGSGAVWSISFCMINPP